MFTTVVFVCPDRKIHLSRKLGVMEYTLESGVSPTLGLI